MRVQRLWLIGFRNHGATDVVLDDRLTLITGANGQGKTNLLEGVAMLAGMKSFRGASTEAMVHQGESQAVIRAEVVVGDRVLLIEIELNLEARSRAQVNRQVVKRSRDLADAARVVVFSPDDLELVKGSPAIRRALMDDVMSSVDGDFRQRRADLDRILRQRNTLLKQARGRITAEVEDTLVVWDRKLIETADVIARGRDLLITELEPVVADYYTMLAGASEPIRLEYVAPWRQDGLAQALLEVRQEEVRRASTLVGPHRDELSIGLKELPARTHGSQGEQRSLALALRLAIHKVLTQRLRTPPIVLLDDVFSELDDGRARRLVACLPEAQTILTSATGTIPDGISPGLNLTIDAGRVRVEEESGTSHG